MNKQIEKRIIGIEIQKEAIEIQRTKQNYTKKELNVMAKATGIKYFGKFNKHDLAEKLGIELPWSKQKQPGNKIFRKARTVEITNPDGTVTIYPSINKAAKILGKPPIQMYVMAVNGKVKII